MISFDVLAFPKIPEIECVISFSEEQNMRILNCSFLSDAQQFKSDVTLDYSYELTFSFKYLNLFSIYLHFNDHFEMKE